MTFFADVRREWLRERQRGLGGTDMASICGCGFQDAAAVYADKTAPEPADREPSPIMAMGLATEEHNAQLYARRTGAKLTSPGLMRSGREPWAFATYDRLRLDEWEFLPGQGAPLNYGGPVELKYVGPFFGDEWGPDGTDQVRDGYVIQATWQLAVLRDRGHRVERCDVSALSGSGEHRVYLIPFDEPLAGLLWEIGRAFWARVESRAGADGWQSPLLEEVAARLVAIRPDTSVRLSGDALEMVEEIDRLSRVKKEGEAAAERIAFLKGRLAATLGDAEVGHLPDGRRVKQYRVPAAEVTPKPYTRPARVDVRILKPRKGKLDE